MTRMPQRYLFAEPKRRLNAKTLLMAGFALAVVASLAAGGAFADPASSADCSAANSAGEAAATDATAAASGCTAAATVSADIDAVAAARSAGAAGSVTFASQVETYLQLPEMPSGCEIVSLATVLRSMGADVSADELLDYLPWDPDGSDFVYTFTGDPYGETGIGYAPALVTGAQNWIAKTGAFNGEFTAVDLTGMTFDQVSALVASGWPVMIWTTTYMQQPESSCFGTSAYELVPNNHCVVLCDVSGLESDGTVQVMDPLLGMVDRDAERFAQIFIQRGCMAMAILPAGQMSGTAA